MVRKSIYTKLDSWGSYFSVNKDIQVNAFYDILICMKFLTPIIVFVLVLAGYLFFTNNNNDSASNDTSLDTPALDSEDADVMIESAEEEQAQPPRFQPQNVSDSSETQDTQATSSDEQLFYVSGVNYEFDLKEIRVKEGDTVTINFISEEGFHDWTLDEFDVQTDAVDEREEASVTFVADQKGTFEYYCSIGNHRERGMVGTLIVE